MRFSFVADHFQYLASLGLIVLGVVATIALLDKIGLRKRRDRIGLGMVVLALLGLLTAWRIPAYKDQVALWKDTLARNPDAWIAHNNLGEILFDAKRVITSCQKSHSVILSPQEQRSSL